MGQSETVKYLKGCQTTSQTRCDNLRLFGTSSVVRYLHKHDGTKIECLVPQGLSDNSTNTMGQNKTVWYLNGCQITSQTRWDKARLFSTSMVVRQLHKHDWWDNMRLFSASMVVRQLHKHEGTKSDFSTSRVVRQLRDKVRLFSTSRVVRQLRKHDGTKWDCLVSKMLSDNSQNSMGKVRLVSTSMVVAERYKHDGTIWACLVPEVLSDNFTNTMGQCETV